MTVYKRQNLWISTLNFTLYCLAFRFVFQQFYHLFLINSNTYTYQQRDQKEFWFWKQTFLLLVHPLTSPSNYSSCLYLVHISSIGLYTLCLMLLIFRFMTVLMMLNQGLSTPWLLFLVLVYLNLLYTFVSVFRIPNSILETPFLHRKSFGGPFLK